jgi:hypothetical protein
MPVMCAQNAAGLAHTPATPIVGWIQDDEPDNAQADGKGGYGPPVPPGALAERYQALKAADPTRPIALNCGQGVAWDGWFGRGTRTNHPEDYPLYYAGCDLASCDIYPVNAAAAEVRGRLWYVAQGIDRLRAATSDRKPAWCWIECTRIAADAPAKPTPAQVRSEVWMALIHGANGIGYFCHSWSPRFDEAALLHDPAMLAAVTAIDQRIAALAPVLTGASVQAGVAVASSDAAVPVDTLVKRRDGATYVFAVAMREGSTTASFTLPLGDGEVEVLDEARSLPLVRGHFSDAFSSYAAHLYRITAGAGGATAGAAAPGSAGARP